MTKLWGGRFDAGLNDMVLEFSSSLSIDQRLWASDIECSLAHAKMLGRQNIISPAEAEKICSALQTLKAQISSELAKANLPFDAKAEDIHSEIERLLREKIGPLAGKLHTARSRNDQVATSFRFQLATECSNLKMEVLHLAELFVTKAKPEINTIMPGLTHFQSAQPVSLAQHLMAYFWMLKRDIERLQELHPKLLSLPLGSAALAGTSFPIDRDFVAKELGFISVCENSMDAVSDRDFCIEILSHLSILMMHLSRFCEELVIWSAPQHRFVELDDSVTTGSSIMPQKKNPDVSELIRGKTGRVYGSLIGALTMMKALPLAYNRDMQEDKYHVFTALDTTLACVQMMQKQLETAIFDRVRMRESLMGDFSNATDLADDLAKKGLPFREAHEVVGKLVLYCLKSNKQLETLTLAELKNFHTLFDQATLQAIQHESVMNARISFGGTSTEAVTEQIHLAENSIVQMRK